MLEGENVYTVNMSLEMFREFIHREDSLFSRQSEGLQGELKAFRGCSKVSLEVLKHSREVPNLCGLWKKSESLDFRCK